MSNSTSAVIASMSVGCCVLLIVDALACDTAIPEINAILAGFNAAMATFLFSTQKADDAK